MVNFGFLTDEGNNLQPDRTLGRVPLAPALPPCHLQVGRRAVPRIETAGMRKVIKIQNVAELLMRNLNDVIKEGNTGENVTHSWNFHSCIIIS